MNETQYNQNSARAEEMTSTLVSRNIKVLGRRTSVRLEPEMWKALKEISNREGCRIHDICSLISLRKKPKTSMTAAIRVFLMLYYRAAATESGHERAGHGDFRNMMQRARVTTGILEGKEGASDSPFHVRKSTQSAPHKTPDHSKGTVRHASLPL